MKTTTTMMATMLSLMGVTPAAAQDPAPVKPVEKKICRSPEVSTGSIMAGKRVCHTKTEWAQIDNANSNSADQALRERNGQGFRRY